MFKTKYHGTLTNIFCLVFVSFFVFPSISNADRKSKVCSVIHEQLALIEKGHISKNFKIYYDYREDGMDDVYQHLDVDNDGIDDTVIRSCGASLDSICHLVVEQSTGKKLELELEGERFFLIRMNSYLYVVVGKATESEKTKTNKHRVYQINKQEIKLICKQI